MTIDFNKLQVFDLKNDRHRHWVPAFGRLVEQIQKQHKDDRLIGNYVDLNQSWTEYEMFNIITQEEKILGFSGMHTHPYPQTVSRVLSRLFYLDDLRQKSLKGHSLPSFASTLMLPLQHQKALELDKEIIFLSFEHIKRRKFCYKLASSLQETFKQNWQVHDKMVNTVRPLPDGSLNYEQPCWQNVIYLKLKDNSQFPLPTMSTEEWERRFADKA